MAYSYDHMQDTARPAYMGSKWKERMELNRSVIDANEGMPAPAIKPGSKISDPEGLGRDVRID